MNNGKIFCAKFDDVGALKSAIKSVRSEGVTQLDVYSPFPIHGIDDVLGYTRSRIGWFPLIGGITGFALGNLMSWWMGAVDYKLIVAGMPFYSWVFTFPIAYELTILFAAFSTLFGMFILNGLPRPHHPIFEYSGWQKITDDKLLLAVADSDPKFNAERMQRSLAALGATDFQTIAAD